MNSTDLNFDCPLCGGNIDIDVRGMGMTLPCPHCGQDIKIPNIKINEEFEGYDKPRKPLALILVLIIILTVIAFALIGGSRMIYSSSNSPAIEEANSHALLIPDNAGIIHTSGTERSIAAYQVDSSSHFILTTSNQTIEPSAVATKKNEEADEGVISALTGNVESVDVSATMNKIFENPALVQEVADQNQIYFDRVPEFDENEIQTSYVLVEGKNKSGSGFVVEIRGKLFVMTNIHVVENNPALQLHTIGRNKLSYYNKLYISKLVDLALIPIKDSADLHQLTISSNIPMIGDTIHAFGNSDGRRVITKRSGKVVAIGNDLIEIDAPVVTGNSGGPIVDEYGEVVGIVSHGELDEDYNWITKGTPSEGVHRFGLRPDTNPANYLIVSFSEMNRAAKKIDKAIEYLTDIATILRCWTPTETGFNERRKFEAAHSYKGMKEYHDTPWFRFIRAFADGYYAFWIDRFRSGNPRYLNSTLENKQKSLEFAFCKILKEMKNDTRRSGSKIFAAKYFRDRRIAIYEVVDLLERSIVDTVKSSDWQLRCIVPQLIKQKEDLNKSEYDAYYYEE